MDVMEAVKNRRSIRKYTSQQVEDEKLKRVLEAARLAPSACNMQPWKFIVVTNEETRSLLVQATDEQWFVREAPVILVACGSNLSSVMLNGFHRYIIDVSIAFSYITLEAQELGLGTCWLGGFKEPRVREILGIPDDMRVVAMTPLGYPGEFPKQRDRKSLKEIVCFEKYNFT